jgi:site-specific recombinase XerD
MNPPASATLSQLVQVFLDEYLPHQRALSPRTVESYRDALRLLLEHLEAQIGRWPAHIGLADCTPQRIQSFLDHLEFERHNSVHSRNLRLAAVRTFLRFAAESGASPAGAIESALRVPAKRFSRPKPQFLSHEQMRAIIGGSDDSWIGRRDHALLSLLYDTAATVSEIIRLRHADFDGDPQVRLRGTRRVRSVPLRASTVAALHAWLALNPLRAPEAALFPNQRGDTMTATCVRRRLALAVTRAAIVDPELRRRRVSPRLVRHTAAMHLLQCGTDLSLISHWLGHDSPATMHNHARAYRMLGEQSGLPCADAFSSLPGRARERGTRGFGVDAPERSP